MERHNLAQAVARLLETGEAQELSKEELRHFHAEFRDEVAPAIDSHREHQRRAYEQMKEIAVR